MHSVQCKKEEISITTTTSNEQHTATLIVLHATKRNGNASWRLAGWLANIGQVLLHNPIAPIHSLRRTHRCIGICNGCFSYCLFYFFFGCFSYCCWFAWLLAENLSPWIGVMYRRGMSDTRATQSCLNSAWWANWREINWFILKVCVFCCCLFRIEHVVVFVWDSKLFCTDDEKQYCH